MADSHEDLVSEAKAGVQQTGVDTVHEALVSGEDITIVDVREPDEYEAEHIPQAKHIPRGMLEQRAAEELPEKSIRIVTHCNAGGRGSLAAKSLQELGYTNVTNLEGGLNAWRERGYEIE
jgi:rhodanese-related sulfurtransferase